ncbi:hypothetical protein ACUOFC_03420, partial [Escherichia sp. TWPC-MK]
MTQKIEQSQRQERVAAWNRRAECDLAAFQNSPKQTYQVGAQFAIARFFSLEIGSAS